ncbi:MAG: CAP domain-containing protein [Candidatus Pacebacteria bacterium]|nr:CAP domain-containing protein [Candidatus Paceibacterota bacterium]MDR3583351.1 CAP domain-containing protein [Candidatus Paceibacterota bacterium]
MKNKTLTKYSVWTAVILGLFFAATGPVWADQITVPNVLSLINQDRETQGLPDLVLNTKLTAAATDHLNDMIANHYFAHNNPQGVTPWHWFDQENYDYRYAGENLAINFTAAEDENTAWMNSPEHKKNILNPNYEETGIAIGAGTVDGQTSLLAVEEFGSRADFVLMPQSKQNTMSAPDKNLIKDGAKIAPQVLSSKDMNLSDQNSVADGAGQNGGALSQARNGFQSSRIDVYALALAGVELIFMFALSLLPLAFIAVAFDKIIFLWETGEPAKETLPAI